MLFLKLDRNDKQPLFEQLVHLVKNKVISGELLPGDKLPSSRDLAEQLGLSRTTICKAYDELYALGYLESYQGGYSKIRQPHALALVESSIKPLQFDWCTQSSSTAKLLHQSLKDFYRQSNNYASSTRIDFSSMAPDPNIMPVNEFRKCLNYVLKSQGSTLLQYGSVLGYLPLREYLAEHLRQYGIQASVDEIMITDGSQQAIDNILQMLIEPGDNVILESPTYSLVMPLIHRYGAKINAISMTNEGINLDLVEQSLVRQKIKLLYTIPNFHNPTGISTSQEHREQLYQLCQKHNVPLVEDGFVDEMKYFGKTPLPIKAMDVNGLVIYIGSFSKILFPGLRVGWIVANRECISTLSSIKLASNLRGHQLSHAALHHFCRLGYYQQHIKRAHSTYRRRMKVALIMAKQNIPEGYFTYSKPNGGYTMLISASDKKVNETALIKAIDGAGVSVSPGNQSFPFGSEYAHFRLSIAMHDEQQIVDGFEKIGRVLKLFC